LATASWTAKLVVAGCPLAIRSSATASWTAEIIVAADRLAVPSSSLFLLSDTQIERFARQIVLPEVGGRGQERLLASCVAVHTSSEAEAAYDVLLLAAIHLGVAGVGALVVPEIARSAVAEALAARNPDVELGAAPRTVDATVVIGDASTLAGGMPTVFAGAGAAELAVVVARGYCAACVRAALPPLAAPETWPTHLAPLLASILATVVLGEILGLDPREEPTLLTIGLRDAGASSRAIAARPGCGECGAPPK
jgi:molybdopterin-synthase adenylyltransferase